MPTASIRRLQLVISSKSSRSSSGLKRLVHRSVILLQIRACGFLGNTKPTCRHADMSGMNVRARSLGTYGQGPSSSSFSFVPFGMNGSPMTCTMYVEFPGT